MSDVSQIQEGKAIKHFNTTVTDQLNFRPGHKI